MKKSLLLLVIILFSIVLISLIHVTLNNGENVIKKYFEPDSDVRCPRCGSLNIEIVGGNETQQKQSTEKLNCNNCGYIWYENTQ